jgi:hypothetical protein
MNWFNILLYSAASGASRNAAKRAEKRAGQNDEENAWIGGWLGCIGLIAVGIFAFSVWKGGIESKAREDALRQIKNQREAQMEAVLERLGNQQTNHP